MLNTEETQLMLDPTPLRLEVRKDGNFFIGDLVWPDGNRWLGWQKHRTLKALKQSARCTFNGLIVRM